MTRTNPPSIPRPAFVYFGGKFRLADRLIALMPPHDIYCEPFGGAASVLLRKPPALIEVHNDLSGDIYNFFTVLRSDAFGPVLMEKLRLTPYSRREFEEALASEDPDPVERARAFYTIVLMSINHGAKNVPTDFLFPRLDQCSDTWKIYSGGIENLSLVRERLGRVVLENRDALMTIRDYDRPGTLFYCDPPYIMKTRKTGRKYLHDMTDEDHVALAETLRSVKGMAMVSGYRCDLYDRLYEGWRRVDFQTINLASKRVTDSVWLSPNVTSRARDGVIIPPRTPPGRRPPCPSC
jgi:DNA adenine methylase